MRQLPLALALAFLLAGPVGCSNNEDETQVTDINATTQNLEVLEPSLFQISFDFDENNVIDGGETVTLVVAVPPQLEYLKGSSELQEWGSGDQSVTPFIRKCANGDNYLVYEFDGGDLDNAYSSNTNADAQLNITLVARRRGEYVAVEAAASLDQVVYGCREVFTPDAQEVVSIE
jgi:hypothetical protein